MNRKICGIYEIVNIKNNKRYIGSSNNIKKRIWTHKNNLLKGKHDNIILQNTWNKYVKSDFKFNVIEECFVKNLLQKEQYYIDKFKCCNKKFGYNIALYSNSGMRDRKHSKKIKRKISKSSLGKKLSEETKKKISESRKGCKNPMFNKIFSEETKKKLRECRLGEKNHFYGKKHSDESKKKISDFCKEKYKGDKHPQYVFIEKNIKKNIIKDYKLGLSMRKVGNIYNYSIEIINRVLKENDIKIRNLSESHKRQVPWNKGLKYILKERSFKEKLI